MYIRLNYGLTNYMELQIRLKKKLKVVIRIYAIIYYFNRLF